MALGQTPRANGVSYRIEPLLGFESVYRATPTPHTATHMMYGARLVGGVPLLSGEIEYTNGSDTENFAVAPEKVKYTDEKVKAGLRSQFNMGSFFNITTRFGGQAKKSTEESTSAGVTTKTEKPIKYDPYLGAALGLHLGKFTLSVGTTVIVNDVNDMQKNDVQNAITFGLGI